MKKENHVLVLGAGFSKAVASAPLTNEMFKIFAELYEVEKIYSIRKFTYDNLMSLVEILDSNLSDKYGKEHSIRIYNEFTVKNNFEDLLTFIDLNLQKVNPNDKENSLELIGAFPIGGIGENLLEESKWAIKTYLYLSLCELDININLEPYLRNFFKNHTNSNLTIITFNYDFLLEQYLYSLGYWFPDDGYFQKIKHGDKVLNNHVSKVKIIKLHGSINWDSYNQFDDSLKLEWRNLNDLSIPLFKEYNKEFNGRNAKFKKYEGKIDYILVTPTAIKKFETSLILKLWKKAVRIIKNANKITVVGYSLPIQDTATTVLFSSVDANNLNKVEIINPDISKDEEDRYNIIFNAKAKYIRETFQDYLRKSPT